MTILLEKVSFGYDVATRGRRRQQPETMREVGGDLRMRHGSTRIRALHDIDLEIESGARIGLIGRNGSGKTTLLKLMAGIFDPTSGKRTIEGRVTPLISVQAGLDRSDTGRENIVTRAMLNGVSRKHAKAAVEDIAEFSGLGPYIDLPVNTYSNGMLARLMFAVATAFDSNIVLIDESIIAGDESFRAKAEARVKEFVDRAGTLVVAAHAPSMLRRFTTRCIWLDQGRLKMFDQTDETLRAYMASQGGQT